jgi:hypothetical protein
MSTIDCILTYMAGGGEVSIFQGVRGAGRSWYLAAMQRKCQNWLTLFVVLPQIGKKKLQTNERMRKTAIKNRNKKNKEQRTCVRCSLACTLPQVLRQTE